MAHPENKNELTPRDVRIKLSTLETWYREREHHFSDPYKVYFCNCFEYAEKEDHLTVLRDEIDKAWKTIKKQQPETA